MLCFIDKTTDPYLNLAAEEYLLENYNEPIFRLWRNSPSVIVGRHQNTSAEINSDFIHKNNIPVVRRLTGGGAVFHDLGNINYTFIDKKIEGEDTSEMFARFTSPIVEALQRIGVDASLQGRNDLVIEGRKFSGNAICVHKGRVLQHGTLLFNSSISDLSGALNARPEKFIGKSIKSNVSRVTNISEHLPQGLKESMGPEGFIDFLYGSIQGIVEDLAHASFNALDMKKIEALADEKYRTDKWNYGESPKYSFSNCVKFPFGLVEVYLNVEKGIIRECRIEGDYFFISPTEELEWALTGVPHRCCEIKEALKKIPLKDYISGMDSESFLKVILPQ